MSQVVLTNRPAPIKIGDTIHVETEVTQKKSVPGGVGGFVSFNVVVNNKRDETTQKGTWRVVAKSRPKQAA